MWVVVGLKTAIRAVNPYPIIPDAMHSAIVAQSGVMGSSLLVVLCGGCCWIILRSLSEPCSSFSAGFGAILRSTPVRCISHEAVATGFKFHWHCLQSPFSSYGWL